MSGGQTQKLDRAGDALLLVVASIVATTVEGGFRWRIALALLVTSALLWLLAARTLRQYDTGNGRGFYGDIALTAVMLAAILVPMAMLGLLLPEYAGAAYVGRFLLVLVPAVLVLRTITIGLQLWQARPIADVLVAGIGPLGRLTGAHIAGAERSRTLVGYLRFEDESMEHRGGALLVDLPPLDGAPRVEAPVLGTIDDLERTLRERVVDEVYFASSAPGHREQIQAAIQTCEKLGIPFALPACTYRLTRAFPSHGGGGLSDGYTHFLTVRFTPWQWWLKRLFDVAASSFALLCLSPLLAFVAIGIKLGSRGPVLFKQDRVGLHGREFHMLKFRSMVVNAEELKQMLLASNEQSGPVFKMQRDPRVTRIGRFIRKFSIDELPQLVNVLRGDMSIVGPRPPLPSEVELYEAWQRRRLSVRPGLTCVWQVSGRNEISFQDWMLLDMRYIDHWSLARDFNLIWKTVPVVLTGRGAS
jgi:exopolysaccharide biosynthesis polyprenyl glycosylphosphotransferase